MSPYARGVALCLVAGLVWSTSGVTFRTLEQPDVWKVSFWRSGTMAASVLLLLLWRYRGGVLGAFRGIGGVGLLAAGFIAGANILVMFSLSLTTVANTMFMLAAQPLMAALLAWVLLKEGVGSRTVIAMVVALAGVGVMVADALGAGDLLGNLLALATALSFALFVVALRAGRSADMLPVLLVAGCLVCAVGFVAAGGEVGMSLHDVLLCVVMGSLQVTLGLVLFVAGSRLLSAGEVTLLSQTEVVLGPLWVFLVYAEAPSMLTLAGGALVLAAVVGQALLGGRFPGQAVSDRAKGVALCLAAGLLWSIAGLLVRSMETATPWQINAWRSTFMALAVFAYLAVRYRGGILGACRAIGRTGLAAAFFVGLSNMCFIVSLAGLTVANALFTFTIKPLLAALLGWVLLRERVAPATWRAMAVAALGIGIMVGGDLGRGTLLLTGVAILGAVAFSFYATLFRVGRGADMMPALGLAGVIVAVIASAAAGFDLAVSLHDLAVLALFGTVQAALGLFLFIAGARYLPAAEIALITLVEIVLGPFWVFLAFDEVPSWATLAGGGLILAAVAWQALAARPRAGAA